MTTRVSRRGLVLGGSALLCACASLPRPGERLAGEEGGARAERSCDHDLCRYWASTPSTPPADVTDDYAPRRGRCTLGLPEGL